MNRKHVRNWTSAMMMVAGIAATAFAAEQKSSSTAPAASKAPASPSTAPAGQLSRDMTVQGTVMVQKDTTGKITGVNLKADDGTVYKCAPHAQCALLEKDAAKSVQCVGFVTTASDGSSTLHIRSIEPQAQPPAK